jgi:site-specific recombinase XerD
MKNELEKHQLNANSLSPEAEFNIIDQIPEELIWLENFTSKATQKTYKSTVKKFCAMFEIQNLDNLRSISSMHIIKFRDAMKANGEKNSSINNRMAGLSSLFKHLDKKTIIRLQLSKGDKWIHIGDYNGN